MAFERVKQFKDVEFHYDAPAGFTLTVYTDMPTPEAGPLAVRRTISFPASTGPRTYTAPLDDPDLVEGTLIKFKVTSTGVVRLYGGVVRCRPVGVYFNGANGEKWESDPIGLGIGIQ